MKIGVSFLKSNYNFSETIKRIDESNADFIHVDIADGLFVNNKTAFNKEMLEILKNSKIAKDVHLMTLHLESFIDVFSKINPKYITFSFEATTNIENIINYIKDKNCKVGIAINPSTDLSVLIPFINSIDLVLIMSVFPGYGGQKFLLGTNKRIEELNKIRTKYKAKFKISVDGGINADTIKLIDKTKLDMAVSGSFICESPNFTEAINKLK